MENNILKEEIDLVLLRKLQKTKGLTSRLVGTATGHKQSRLYREKSKESLNPIVNEDFLYVYDLVEYRYKTRNIKIGHVYGSSYGPKVHELTKDYLTSKGLI